MFVRPILLYKDLNFSVGKQVLDGVEFPETIEIDGLEYTLVNWGEHDSSYDGIVRRVKNPFFSKVFDQDATSITDLLDKIFNPGQISVFPTEYISAPRIRDLIVLTIMLHYSWNK